MKHPESDARMVDVTAKEVTTREADASGFVRMSPSTREAVTEGRLKKGDALETARIAGIMAAAYRRRDGGTHGRLGRGAHHLRHGEGHRARRGGHRHPLAAQVGGSLGGVAATDLTAGAALGENVRYCFGRLRKATVPVD